MRGSIKWQSDNSYRVRASIGKDPISGKYISHFETVKGNKKDAERRLRELLTEVDKGTFIEPGKITLGNYLSQWLRDYVIVNLSPRTYEGYEYIIRYHLTPVIGNIPLSALKPEHVQHYLATKLSTTKANCKAKLSNLSVRHHAMLLHKALKTACQLGLLQRNPTDNVVIPKATQIEMQIWDVEEVKRFLDTAISSQYYPLFFIALYTGARRSELLALRWSDVDLLLCTMSINRNLHQINKQYVFTQPKTNKSRRVIDLSPDSVQVLRNHHNKQAMDKAMADIKIQESDLIFSTYDNRPWRPNTISRAWVATAKRAGVKVIRFHDARHTHASLMLKQGIHPKVVQERLGHSTISTTLDIYSHVAPGIQKAAAQRFDEMLKVSYNGDVTKWQEKSDRF
jgi:integrase